MRRDLGRLDHRRGSGGVTEGGWPPERGHRSERGGHRCESGRERPVSSPSLVPRVPTGPTLRPSGRGASCGGRVGTGPWPGPGPPGPPKSGCPRVGGGPGGGGRAATAHVPCAAVVCAARGTPPRRWRWSLLQHKNGLAAGSMTWGPGGVRGAAQPRPQRPRALRCAPGDAGGRWGCEAGPPQPRPPPTSPWPFGGDPPEGDVRRGPGAEGHRWPHKTRAHSAEPRGTCPAHAGTRRPQAPPRAAPEAAPPPPPPPVPHAPQPHRIPKAQRGTGVRTCGAAGLPRQTDGRLSPQGLWTQADGRTGGVHRGPSPVVRRRALPRSLSPYAQTLCHVHRAPVHSDVGDVPPPPCPTPHPSCVCVWGGGAAPQGPPGGLGARPRTPRGEGGATTTGADATPPPPPPAICQNLGGGGWREGGGGGVLAAPPGGGGGLRATHYYHMHTSRGCVCVWGAWGYRGMYAIIAISRLCREESLKGLKDQTHKYPLQLGMGQKIWRHWRHGPCTAIFQNSGGGGVRGCRTQGPGPAAPPGACTYMCTCRRAVGGCPPPPPPPRHTHDERDQRGTGQGGLNALDLVRCGVQTNA